MSYEDEEKEEFTSSKSTRKITDGNFGNEQEDDTDEEPVFDEEAIYYCEKCELIIDGSTPTKRREVLAKYKKLNGKMLKDITVCPVCGGKLKKITKKQMDKIVLKKRLKELAKEEAENEIAEKETAIDVCNYVVDETIDLLDVLEYGLVNGKIGIEYFDTKFSNEAFKILMLRKKEYMPSNHFIKGFRDYINDYNKCIAKEIDDIEPSKIVDKSKEYKLDESEQLVNKSLRSQMKEFKKQEGKERDHLKKGLEKMVIKETK